MCLLWKSGNLRALQWSPRLALFWQFVLLSPPWRGAELACSFICPTYLHFWSRKITESSSYLMLFLSLRETRVMFIMFTYSPSQGSVSMQSFSCYIFYLPSIFCYRLCIKRSCFITVFSCKKKEKEDVSPVLWLKKHVNFWLQKSCVWHLGIKKQAPSPN